jgi:hypothetical protein
MLTLLTMLALCWGVFVAFAVALARSSSNGERVRHTWIEEIATAERVGRFRRSEVDLESPARADVGHVPA